jgi:hypothetical protein
MTKVRDIEYPDRFSPGDAAIVNLNGDFGVFYLLGVLLDKKYLAGELRFVKDKQGELNMYCLEQHKGFPEKAYGRYSKVKSIQRCNLNSVSLPFSLLKLDQVVCILRARDTFCFRIERDIFTKEIRELFPNYDLGIVGSSNVGLDSNNSDLDIYVYSGKNDGIFKSIRDNPGQFGLKFNLDSIHQEMIKLIIDYGFTEHRAKEICEDKLCGLEYMGQVIHFYGAEYNPFFKYLFSPNCNEKANLVGEVSDASFSGHFLPTYKATGEQEFSFALLRGMFRKKKRYVVRIGDKLKVKGNLINKDPKIILAQDLVMLNE